VSAVLSHPGVVRLFALNVLARLPGAASGVLLVVHAHALTGSYAAAGAVAAANALAVAGSSPILGGLVDRRGQTGVLLWSGLVGGLAYVALALLPHAAPLAALVALAAVAGLAQPPLGACLRTLWGQVLDGDREAINAAFAVEAAAMELTYILGPAGFLVLAALTSSGLAIGALGAMMAVATAAFAAEPASRGWVPETIDDGDAPRGSALRAPGVLTIAAVMTLVGVVMGGVEVGVTAAGNAHGAGTTSVLLALWGLGSMIGGVAAARFSGPRGARELIAVAGALGVTHVLLAAGAGSPVALAGLLLIAGFWIAPTFATATMLTGELALPGTTTEAFSWTMTALAAGVAGGSALAGAVIDASGTGTAFAVAGAAGVLAAGLAASRARTLHAAGATGAAAAV
jgi:predicted MFS family arabinose efflux permease